MKFAILWVSVQYKIQLRKSISYFIVAAVCLTTASACQSAYTNNVYDKADVIVRHNADKPLIYWAFSADSLFEGGPMCLDVLNEKGIKASFFFTGKFLRDSANNAIIKRVIADGHYVGPHGDKHILLAEWDSNRTPLVSADSLLADVRDNIVEFEKFGVSKNCCRWFMPSYEWISKSQVAVLHDNMTIEIINLTPGIQIYRDYTTPDMPDYISSDSIISQLYSFEESHTLNGAILIMHLGTSMARTDKLYYHLSGLIDTLQSKGYKFARFD